VQSGGRMGGASKILTPAITVLKSGLTIVLEPTGEKSWCGRKGYWQMNAPESLTV
jgi:hypothetical protein